MISKFNDYEQTQAFTETKQLPRGGYICKIAGAKVESGKNGGQYIKIAFDISEGEYKGYFQERYDAKTDEDKKWPGVYTLNVPKDDGSERDSWTKRRFKTFTNALEDSNEGYHFDWDETKFKGKLVGLIFNYREYFFNGKNGMTPNVAQATSVEKIREGNFKIPEDRMLEHTTARTGSADVNAFVNVGSSTEEEIPF